MVLLFKPGCLDNQEIIDKWPLWGSFLCPKLIECPLAAGSLFRGSPQVVEIRK